jgi:hypothetical protein
MTTIRPLQQKDFDVLLDLANRAVLFAPKENAEWLEYRSAFDESKHVRRHYLALTGEQAIGYSCLEQQSDDAAQLRVYNVYSPANLQGEVGDGLYSRLVRDATELRAARLWAREFQAGAPIRILREPGLHRNAPLRHTGQSADGSF